LSSSVGDIKVDVCLRSQEPELHRVRPTGDDSGGPSPYGALYHYQGFLPRHVQMCHTSPSTFLLWSLLSSTLFVFLVSHLWSFDRFRCLRWRTQGKGSGAFKRVMTYTYLLSVPLLAVYACGFAVIKYSEGYIDLPQFGIIPTPYLLWSPAHQSLIFPLFMLFSVAWGLEIVTHLEELCFWLFLLHSSKSEHLNWFTSIHFRTWLVGSILAVVGIPLTTFLNRADPLQAEAWTFLIASSGSLALTLSFLPVLFMFPGFLQRLKAAGTQPHVVLRLCKFHDLNIIRVVFRFVFVVPFFILGIDGVQPVHVINESWLWTDLLAMAGSLGCITSSVLTLLIFFPRNLESEAGYANNSRQYSTVQTSERRNSDYYAPRGYAQGNPPRYATSPATIQEARGTYFELYKAANIDTDDKEHDIEDPFKPDEFRVSSVYSDQEMEQVLGKAITSNQPLPPTRNGMQSLALPTPAQQKGSSTYAVRRPSARVYPPRSSRSRFGGGASKLLGAVPPRIHPIIANYRSPIDLLDSYIESQYGPNSTRF